jgi:competence protein ComEC
VDYFHTLFLYSYIMKTITWREIPLLKILPAFILGILYPIEGLPLQGLYLFLTLLIIFINLPLVPVYRTPVGLSILFATYLLGTTVVQFENRNTEIPANTNYAIGEIEEIGTTDKFTNFTVHLYYAKGENWKPSNGTILLKIKNKALPYKRGDIIGMASNLKELTYTPDAIEFNYENYLLKKGISNLAYCNPTDILKIEEQRDLFTSIDHLRRKLIFQLKKNIPSKNEEAVLSSIILGNKTEIPVELKQAYKKAGAMHILAVSGLHVGICFLLINFFFKNLKTNNLYSKFGLYVCKISAIFFYVLITGSSTSAIRASTMFALYQFGKDFYLSQCSINTLSGTALLILILNPITIYDVGFQFSFGALAGILTIYPILKNLYISSRKWKNHFWQITVIGISAQLGLIPFLLLYTGELPTYFLITGILVMDLTFLLLISGILILPMETIFPLEGYGFKILEILATILNRTVEFIASFPLATMQFTGIDNQWVFNAYLVFAVFLISLHNHSKVWTKLFLYTILIIGIIEGIHSIIFA